MPKNDENKTYDLKIIAEITTKDPVNSYSRVMVARSELSGETGELRDMDRVASVLLTQTLAQIGIGIGAAVEIEATKPALPSGVTDEEIEANMQKPAFREISGFMSKARRLLRESDIEGADAAAEEAARLIGVRLSEVEDVPALDL